MKPTRELLMILALFCSATGILGIIYYWIACFKQNPIYLIIQRKNKFKYCMCFCLLIGLFWNLGYKAYSEYIIKPHQIISQKEFFEKTEIERDEKIINVSFSKQKIMTLNQEEKYIYDFYNGGKYCGSLEINDAYIFNGYDALEVNKIDTSYLLPEEYQNFVETSYGETENFYAYEILDGVFTQNSKLLNKEDLKDIIDRRYQIYKNEAEKNNNSCYFFIYFLTLVFVIICLLFCYLIAIDVKQKLDNRKEKEHEN